MQLISCSVFRKIPTIPPLVSGSGQCCAVIGQEVGRRGKTVALTIGQLDRGNTYYSTIGHLDGGRGNKKYSTIGQEILTI